MASYKFRVRWRGRKGNEYVEYQTSSVERVIYRVAHVYFYNVSGDDESALLEMIPLDYPHMIRVGPEHVDAAVEMLTQQGLSSTDDYLFSLFRTRDYLFWFKRAEDGTMLKVFYGTAPVWDQ